MADMAEFPNFYQYTGISPESVEGLKAQLIQHGFEQIEEETSSGYSQELWGDSNGNEVHIERDGTETSVDVDHPASPIMRDNLL